MKLFLAFILSVSTVVFAEADPKFSEHKAKMLERIGKEISILENDKKCIEGASDKDAAKKCQETAKAERMKSKKDRIDADIKHLEEKKKELEAHK